MSDIQEHWKGQDLLHCGVDSQPWPCDAVVLQETVRALKDEKALLRQALYGAVRTIDGMVGYPTPDWLWKRRNEWRLLLNGTAYDDAARQQQAEATESEP